MERYKSIQAGNLILGDGIPKICVPIVADTIDKAVEQAEQITGLEADFVEWRIDFLLCPADVVSGIVKVKEALGTLPLLVTFRTKAEGGNQEYPREDYVALNKAVIETGLADLIDVELFTGDDACREVIAKAHEHGCTVIMSSHDFEKTPSEEEMTKRLCAMQALGADVTKLAVMPQCAEDVTRLFAASTAMRERLADRPFVTMSMGSLGAPSRVCGGLTGSAVTFGSARRASAPGQLAVADLANILRLLGCR